MQKTRFLFELEASEDVARILLYRGNERLRRMNGDG